MPSRPDELLSATIRHLEELKARGERFVNVDPAVLARLSEPRASRAVAPGSTSAQTAQPVRPAPAATPQAPKPAPPSVPELFNAPGAGRPSTMPELSREAKIAAMSALRQRVLVCILCPHLVSSRKSVVFGVGDIHSPLMFVGEAPGADEDEQGEPFVGKAGQLLTRIIQVMGFTRETVYIANILKCRPDTPGQLAGNRKPTPAEMKTCLPHLLAQIDIIRPRVIVALGATAVEGLLGKTIGITRLRGNWRSFQGTPLMPTYHPAYLLRNQSLRERRRVWEDMLLVLERLGQPISEKQRGYFLKAG